jgi:hypothetical protein
MIAWKYINKNAATISVMRDYKNMRFIIDNTPDEIIEVRGKMIAPSMPKMIEIPSSRTVQAGAEMVSSHIDKLDVLRDRYAAAIEYLAWFEPAWKTLDDTERHFLSEFYMSRNLNSGATYRLMEEYRQSESHVERTRANALKHLRILLFG